MTVLIDDALVHCVSFQDVATYSVLSFLYLFATSLVASAIDYYQRLEGNVTQWTIEQLIVAVVSMVFVCCCFTFYLLT